MSDFRSDLTSLLNRYSQENGSDTPDFILAKYLDNCLTSWNHAIAEREEWYGRESRPSNHCMEENREMHWLCGLPKGHLGPHWTPDKPEDRKGDA